MVARRGSAAPATREEAQAQLLKIDPLSLAIRRPAPIPGQLDGVHADASAP